jgi:signal transduction histidine kinase
LPQEDISLDQARATGMFRIFQEALTNVLRYASTRKVTVQLIPQPDALLLEVVDDGQGITLEQLGDPRSLGLLSMRERAHLLAGDVSIQGKLAEGTIVTLQMPYAGSPAGGGVG